MFFTKRLMLRGLDVAADMNVLLQWHNSVTHLHGLTADTPYPRSREWVRKFIERNADPENKEPCFMICYQPTLDGKPLQPADDYFLSDDGQARYPGIGLVYLKLVNHLGGMSRVAMLGINIDERHTGQGYGTEVLEWLCEYVFRTLGLHRLELHLDATNTRAYRCYQKVGFVEEGRRRKRSWRDGEWRDHIEMGMLEEDWRQRNPMEGSFPKQ